MIFILYVEQAVIVEGKYDKIKLSSVMSGVILCTDGFRIFKDKEKMQIIRHYAQKKGIIILTDSDTAGFKIRNYIKGAVGKVPDGNLINVYIPDIFGKERRKTVPSKEGKLGVEGMDPKVLEEAFAKAGITSEEKKDSSGGIDKLLLYELGYSGRENSSERRRILLKAYGLPELMTTNAAADILNTMISAEELEKKTAELFDKNS
ncbi:MAG: toprim domain-containing protein [Huintestinicola sp.]